MPGPDMDVAEMLALRTWALEVLTGDATTPDEGTWDAILGCSAGSWKMFLVVERCALPLTRRLAEMEGGVELPSAGAAALRRAALRESRRVLSVRAQIELLARIAREEGWRLVVLKGGVPVARGRFELDTFDVDVLAPADGAEELARRLDERGFASPGNDSPHHLAPRVSEGTVAVEVHRGLKEIDRLEDFRRRIRPLDGASAGLWRLHPVDHVWQLLVHAAVQHPDRRGCIRELLLLRSALEDVSAADVREVHARVAAHGKRDVFERALAAARAFDRGETPRDPFRDERIPVYVFASRFGGMLTRGRVGRILGIAVLRRLTGGRARWRDLAETLARPTPSPYWFAPIEWLRRRWAVGGRVAHQTARVGRFTVAAMLAAVVRVQIVWLRRRLARSS